MIFKLLFLDISLSDWIQISIALITLLGILTSLYISIRTLKQNSLMIEETTRPNVIFYKDVLNINTPVEYLVIKNIGNSIAHIISINFDEDKLLEFKKNNHDLTNAIKYLNNSYLAPNQSYKIPIDTKKSDVKKINFTISYCNDVKNYHETYTLNLKQDYGIGYIQQHQSNNEIKVISNAIQELIKRIS